MVNIIDEKLNAGLDSLVNTLTKSLDKFARFFGYPENEGMLWKYSKAVKAAQRAYIEDLPRHEVAYPPMPTPNNIVEVVFGTFPEVKTIEKNFYESKVDGFYNFYIQNYSNVHFLPDWMSEFIQMKLNFCLDITALIYAQEILFVLLTIYYQIVLMRLTLYWFIFINPYTWPWWPLVFFVDWTEDVLSGFVPVIGGVNLTGTLLLTLLGKMADSLNHLVLTMPFLPSEAQKIILIRNEEPTDFLVFRYLPLLWYKYPIPNEIRKFWYNDRPEILKYMQETYKDLNIQFLPDEVVEKMNMSLLLKPEEPIIVDDKLTESISMVSSIIQLLDQSLHDFMITHIDKLA